MNVKKNVVKLEGYAMDAVQKGFHAVTFLVYSYGLYFDLYEVVIPPTSTSYRMTFHVIGGRWKYWEHISLVLQCAFFGLCVLNDLIGSETVNLQKRSFLQKLRDGLLSTLVVPLGVFVPVFFWSLFVIDRELHFPASMKSWFPGWLSHIMHTLPFFASIIEIIVTNHVYPKGLVLYFPIVVASGLYIAWLYYIAHHTRNLRYPAYEVMDFKNRAVFMACMVPPNLLIVFLGHRLHLAVWGPAKESTRRRGKKDKSH